MKETITRAHEKTGSHRDIRAEGYPAPPSGWGEYSRTDKKFPEPLTVDAVCAEVLRARLKFPGNRHMLAALTEEVGELAQALLQGKPRDEIEKEAIQVACVAIRIIEEGDASFAGRAEDEKEPCRACAQKPAEIRGLCLGCEERRGPPG